MNPSNDDIRFERLLQRIDPGSVLLRSWSLTGGVSAQVTALETIGSNGSPRRLVARRHGAADRKRCPQIASREFTLLQRLHTAGLATPRPVSLDESGEMVAVIDWEDAVIGDPLSDLANSRLEILWALGEDAMERFTQRYRSLIPQLDIADLPFWDLWAALRPARNMGSWGLDVPTERTMRAGLQRFLQQALARLPTL